MINPLPLPAADDPGLDPADMDPSIDPAVDFYAYANGGWKARNPVPPQYARWAAFEEIRRSNEDLIRTLLESSAAEPDASDKVEELAGAYYRAGMNTDRIESAGLEPLRRLLEEIDHIDGPESLRTVAARLAPTGVSLPVSLSVAPDFDNSQQHLLYLGQGGLGLPERDYYFRDDEASTTLRAQYEEHIAAILELSQHADPGTAATQILELETALAEAAHTATELRDLDLVLNRRTAAEIAELMPSYDLPQLLAGASIPPLEAANIGNPAFLAAADRILAETASSTLRAYARWAALRATASGLSANFEDESFRFYGQILGGQQQQKDRWQRVQRAATVEIGQVVSQLYVARAFRPDSRKRAQALVDRLLEAMGDSIREATWMSEETAHAALVKLAAFTTKIGYPDVWIDYSGLQLSGEDPWITVRLAARAFEFRRKVAQLDQPVDPNEWAMAPHEVNAYFHPLRTEIVFPAGILQPPFFDAAADDAVNYGAIGAIIGHEITHGFDDKGSRFDDRGQFSNWWRDDDRAEFERRAQVLIDQFDAYEVVDDLSVNGRLTLGENIADLGGISIAFRALQQAAGGSSSGPALGGLTPEQRFFLSYARAWRSNETDEYLRLRVRTDPHAPPQFRCNGPLGNTPEFAAAFGIPEGSPMARSADERAKVW